MLDVGRNKLKCELFKYEIIGGIINRIIVSLISTE